MARHRTNAVLRALLAVSVTTWVPASAGTRGLTGQFTLPVTTIWGASELAPGRYTIKVPSQTAPQLVYLHGGDVTAVLLPAVVRKPSGHVKSELKLVHDGSSYHVRTLRLPDLGVVFEFEMSRSPGSGAGKEDRRPDVTVPLKAFVDSSAHAMTTSYL